MKNRLTFRWLGVAGLELTANDQTLLIDPLVTRFPLWKIWIGRIHPDHERIAELVPRANAVLVTHAHWDHVMDVPQVARNTGATALGSPQTCRLLEASGVPPKQIREIEAGDALTLGDFRVEVLPAEHMTFLGRPILNGALPPDLQPPLRARDYRMDRYFSFLIEVNECRLLDWCGERAETAVKADLLLARPFQTHNHYTKLLGVVEPRIVIPTHWDDLFRPLTKPVRPTLKPPFLIWPPLRRVDLSRFKQVIKEISPGTRVIIPERFRTYGIGRDILDAIELSTGGGF